MTRRQGSVIFYRSKFLNPTGSTSGTSTSQLLSFAKPPKNIAWKTGLAVARMYLCAGMRSLLVGGPT